MPPLPPFEPTDAQTAAAMLAVAAADQIPLVPQGHGTKLRIPADTSGVTVISAAHLTAGLVHYAGDLVATAPAGATLRDVNATLAKERQWIPLDPPFMNSATIGGIVACNDSGPRRHRYGAPRDLIIGIEVALTNGRVVHAGGRVVKNVAGYDLSRLFCGSRGSLGLITAVTFKLAPVAPASRTVVARFGSAAHAVGAAVELAASASLTPSTVEFVAPHPRLLVRFESTARAADRMASAAAATLTAQSSDVLVLDGTAEEDLWIEHQRTESAPGGLTAVCSVLPTMLAPALADLERLASVHTRDWSITGRATLGVLRVQCDADPGGQVSFARAARAALAAHGGHLQVLSLDRSGNGDFDPFGQVGSAASVGAAVKRRFDPTGVLPYPWARE